MSSSHKSTKFFVFLVIVAAIGLCVFLFKTLWWDLRAADVSHYKGDGQIKPIGGNGIDRGYLIEFEKFNINSEHTNTYSISHFPDLEKDATLYLRVYKPYQDFKKILENQKEASQAMISLSVANKNGSKIFALRSPLKNLTLTSRNGNTTDLYYFSKESSSGIPPKELQKGDIKIEFSYQPNDATFPENFQGALIVISGGHK